MIGLGLQFKSKLAKIALFWGVIAALGAIGVGLVPMNYLTYHLDAANTFFSEVFSQSPCLASQLFEKNSSNSIGRFLSLEF